MRVIVWLRRDLRLQDNPALFHAAKKANNGVVAVYFVTSGQWREHDDAACKVDFWMRNLKSLSNGLVKLNIPLRIINCTTFDEIPTQLTKAAKQWNCEAIYFNREYEVNEQRRDDTTARVCAENNIAVHTFDDRAIIPPGKVLTRQNTVYTVFTPFRKVWDTQYEEYMEPLSKPKKQKVIDIGPSTVPDKIDGFEVSEKVRSLWPAGEKSAHTKLTEFANRISDYKVDRDFPARPGTSQLSPYIAAGILSSRHCLTTALAMGDNTLDGNAGVQTWIAELAWRDFYMHVLVGFPRVSMNQPFLKKTRGVQWRNNQNDFQVWCEGKTGYPIVDAAMRQLNETGWMHNRLRMVAAMFLSKHLLIDWRWGEKYFMQHLVDGDLAANNGGWQWAASTGTDAAPYFRIFNPFSQSKRFDPDGTFTKSYCPELADLPATVLHDEKKLADVVSRIHYPACLVEHAVGRDRAKAAFESLS